MHRAEKLLILEHAIEQGFQADGVGVEHRPAAIARETVTGGPHHVDVACANRHALLEDAHALVEQRIQAALDDFLRTVFALRHVQLAGAILEDGERLGVVVALAVASLVAVVTLAVLLAQATRLDQGEIGLVIVRIRRKAFGIRLVHVHADVDTGHVEHGEDAHRHAPLFERGIDLAWRGALQHHALGLARIAFHHAVADEAVTHSCQHRRLAQGLGQVHDSADGFGRRIGGAHHLQQGHDVRGREKVHADDVARTRGGAGDLIDIERGGIAGQHGAGLGHLVQPGEYLLLERHVLEYRFDDDVGVFQVGVVERGLDQPHALGLVLGRNAPALDHGRIRPVDAGEAAIQGLAAGIDHDDRQAGVGEADGDAAAHGAGADDAALLHLARPGLGRQVGHAAGFAVGEEGVHRAAGFIRHLGLVHQLGFQFESALERQRQAGLHRLDGGERRCSIRVLARGLGRHSRNDFIAAGGGIDTAFGGAARSLACRGQLTGVIQRGLAQIAFQHRVEKSPLQGNGGVDRLRVENHLQRSFHADQAWHALRAASARE